MGALPSGKNLGPDTSPSPKMYGLILQNMAEYIQNKHGDNMWKKVGNNPVKNLKPPSWCHIPKIRNHCN